jgi:hypothetical protein
VVTYIVSENVNETNKMGYKVVFDKVEDDVWCLSVVPVQSNTM